MLSNTLHNVHPPTKCVGDPCVFHNPTDHPMRGWNFWYHSSTNVLYRTCEHGYVHPDPDSAWYFNTHTDKKVQCSGGDGCCTDCGDDGLEDEDLDFDYEDEDD